MLPPHYLLQIIVMFVNLIYISSHSCAYVVWEKLVQHAGNNYRVKKPMK